MVVFPIVLFFVLIGLMMVASNNLSQSGKVQKMQPIKDPIKDPIKEPMAEYLEGDDTGELKLNIW
jgi:hypothetical protein